MTLAQMVTFADSWGLGEGLIGVGLKEGGPIFAYGWYVMGDPITIEFDSASILHGGRS